MNTTTKTQRSKATTPFGKGNTARNAAATAERNEEMKRQVLHNYNVGSPIKTTENVKSEE